MLESEKETNIKTSAREIYFGHKKTVDRLCYHRATRNIDKSEG